jgi:hypothetical protein
MKTHSKTIIRSLLLLLGCMFAALFVTNAFVLGSADLFSGSLALAFTFGDVDWEGGDNIGGFTSQGWMGIFHEIHAWPEQDRNASTDEGLIELTGNYVMKEGKKFYKIYITQRTAGAESENQGEIDGKSFLQKPTFFIPGSRVETMAFARKINNTRGILLLKDPNTGEMIQFGDKDFPLHFMPRLAFGNQPTDRRGLFVDCEADNFNAALIYKGTIPLDPAPAP